MKLATFQAPGEAQLRSGLVADGRVTAFGGPDGVTEVLAGGEAPAPSGESWPLDAVTLAAPVRTPGTIYAIGRNYADHIAEMRSERPSKPLVFVKVAASVAPPGGPVLRPAVVRELDYEGELAIVIGAGGTVAGFCVADDVSARDLQRSESQWTRAKGADSFCPFGPWVTTADEVPDPGSLRIRTWVNGELRQDASTSLLLFGIEEIVAFIAETQTLSPGDLILTGTPNGVGAGMDPPRFLAPADVVRVEIDGLGAIEHPVV
jgi:2-keto-4-pentenoate hydratase/2-oxohepta-3-ene-1,7-dioic acid hydratase in catechol pathway